MTIETTILASTTSDNFFYLIESSSAPGRAMLVDPVDARLAIAALEERGAKLDAILVTHWHPDHVSGNAEVRRAYPDAAVIVPATEAEQIEDLTGVEATRRVTGGDVIAFGEESITVHDLPGHTMGHVGYEVANELFCGDVIFSAGVGHCKFGGDVATLYQTIRKIVESFSGELTLYCGHDYAEKNAEFALQFEPDHVALRARHARAVAEPARVMTPPTLEQELTYNPFLRTHEPALLAALEAYDGGAPWSVQREAHPEATASEIAFRMLRGLRDHN